MAVFAKGPIQGLAGEQWAFRGPDLTETGMEARHGGSAWLKAFLWSINSQPGLLWKSSGNFLKRASTWAPIQANQIRISTGDV